LGEIKGYVFSSPSSLIRSKLGGEGQLKSTIPPLPDYYVKRDEYLSKLILLFCNQPAVDMKPDRGIALVGFAGVGKTILAQALTLDENVEKSFPNGILWADLGPNLADERDTDEILSKWLQAIGANPEFYPTLNSKLSAIRVFIGDDTRLIVLNDVWNLPPARLLLSICGQNTRVLITSRNKELVQRLGITKIIEVGSLDPVNALELIEKRLNRRLSDAIWEEQAKPILERVDWNALAISLTAAQIAVGDRDWLELLREFENLHGNLPIDFNDPVIREESIKLSIDLSVLKLDEKSKERFAWIGVLARSEYYVLEHVAMLWAPLIYPDYPKEVTDLAGSIERTDYTRKESLETINKFYRLGLILATIQFDDSSVNTQVYRTRK
jgi:hypothetical protein